MKNSLKKRFHDKFYDLFEDEEDLITQLNETEYISLKNEMKFQIDKRAVKRSRLLKPISRTIWFQYSGAAAIITLICISVFFLVDNRKSADNIGKADQFIKPGGNNAVLTLANGQQIRLNNSKDGKIAAQGGVDVIKTKEGVITYLVDRVDNPAKQSAEVLKNTITTPSGGEYVLVLPDGTEVYLNSSSSLTYPTSFDKGERIVELKGEAYFTVTKDASRPFKVISGAHMVEVLGTEFNINAYDDEPYIRTTLAEGSVKVVDRNNTEKLSPGQQLIAGKGNSTAFTKRIVKVEKYIAWKNGLFAFENDDVKSVMRQISRWYDVEIIYDGEVNGSFSGELFKSSKLSTLLKILEINGLRFAVKNKSITVSQNN